MTTEMLRSDDPCAIARTLTPAAPSEPVGYSLDFSGAQFWQGGSATRER